MVVAKGLRRHSQRACVDIVIFVILVVRLPPSLIYLIIVVNDLKGHILYEEHEYEKQQSALNYIKRIQQLLKFLSTGVN